jgi:hypothetical protein
MFKVGDQVIYRQNGGHELRASIEAGPIMVGRHNRTPGWRIKLHDNPRGKYLFREVAERNLKLHEPPAQP